MDQEIVAAARAYVAAYSSGDGGQMRWAWEKLRDAVEGTSAAHPRCEAVLAA